MAFESILRKLLSNTPGSIGALLLDWEGESVEIVAVDIPDEELRLVGAYQAVFLDRLQRICSETDVGVPFQFEILFEGTVFLNAVLRDGYYAVLVLRSDASRSLAWQKLDFCRAELLKEMG